MASSAAFSIACASAAWVMRCWLQRLDRKIKMNNDESIHAYAYQCAFGAGDGLII